jgi:hypothetical protein
MASDESPCDEIVSIAGSVTDDKKSVEGRSSKCLDAKLNVEQ